MTERELTRDSVARDPFAQFGEWFAQAGEAGLPEPNAMVLATASAAGAPSQRNVLLKSFDRNGFVFFTNHASRKAQQMRANAVVSALFAWYVLHRQVIIEGAVEAVAVGESNAYFQSRPREARIGAWASRQSAPLTSRAELDARVAKITARFGNGEIPLPEFWGGYRIRPQRIEFWQGQSHRLHDRVVYTRGGAGWEIGRLYP